jgi:hypothetical protein
MNLARARAWLQLVTAGFVEAVAGIPLLGCERLVADGTGFLDPIAAFGCNGTLLGGPEGSVVVGQPVQKRTRLLVRFQTTLRGLLSLPSALNDLWVLTFRNRDRLADSVRWPPTRFRVARRSGAVIGSAEPIRSDDGVLGCIASCRTHVV